MAQRRANLQAKRTPMISMYPPMEKECQLYTGDNYYIWALILTQFAKVANWSQIVKADSEREKCLN